VIYHDFPWTWNVPKRTLKINLVNFPESPHTLVFLKVGASRKLIGFYQKVTS